MLRPYPVCGLAMGCWVALACSGLGCLSVEPEPRTVEPLSVSGGVPAAEVDLRQLPFTPGLADVALDVPGQGRRGASVWVPEAAAPRTLLVFLHGRAGGRSGAAAGEESRVSRCLVSCLLVPALESLDPLIIAPHGPGGQWWNRSETQLVLGLVLGVRQRWPEAGERSVILGYSNGGIGTWYFARLYPEYFRAAIPMAFDDTIVGESPLPIYAIVGTKDEQFDFSRVRAALEAQIRNGRDVTLKAKYRGSHRAGCSYVPELESAGQWLETHVFSPARPPG